jgi:hypothetical protein
MELWSSAQLATCVMAKPMWPIASFEIYVRGIEPVALFTACTVSSIRDRASMFIPVGGRSDAMHLKSLVLASQKRAEATRHRHLA